MKELPALKRIFRRHVSDDKDLVITIDLMSLGLSGDVIADAAQVARLLGVLADLDIEYRERKEILEAEYRIWRSRKFRKLDRKNPGLAKTKLDELVRAEKGYRTWWERLAEVKSFNEALPALREAVREKSRLVDAMIRGEMRDLVAEALSGGSGKEIGVKFNYCPVERNLKNRRDRVKNGLKQISKSKEK